MSIFWMGRRQCVDEDVEERVDEDHGDECRRWHCNGVSTMMRRLKASLAATKCRCRAMPKKSDGELHLV